MHNVFCFVLLAVCVIQAAPAPYRINPRAISMETQIQPIIENLHQRLDSVIHAIRTDVQLTESQIKKSIENNQLSSTYNQMELVKGLIKKIQDVINTSGKKIDCISVQKDQVESLQKNSNDEIQQCSSQAQGDMKKLSEKKIENIEQAVSLKTKVGTIIDACVKFQGHDDLMVDCLKLRAEEISQKIFYLSLDIEDLKAETSSKVPKIFGKQMVCDEYIKKQSTVEGNLILEKLNQCLYH